MHAFDYQRPSTLEEAVALLDRHGQDARVLAGGTDLVIGLRDHAVAPAVVIDPSWSPSCSPPSARPVAGCRSAPGRP
jgi:carbon-monoxide dehydrogenase medium subunit